MAGERGGAAEEGREIRHARCRKLLFFKIFYYICGSSVFRCPREMPDQVGHDVGTVINDNSRAR